MFFLNYEGVFWSVSTSTYPSAEKRLRDMTISSRMRSAYTMGLLLLVCSFSSKVQANDNPNAQKISITHPLLEGYDLHHPEISPNDSLIAFSVSKKATWQKCTIWIREIASGKVWQITREDSSMNTGDVLVRWSPDMTKLVFSSDRSNEFGIYIAELESGTITKIKTGTLKGMAWSNRVSWTPDSKHIVAAIGNEDGDNLYQINIDTHEAIKISQFKNKSINLGVDLSNDGKTALYTSGTQLESFEIDSQSTSIIECDIPSPDFPTWSPDKKWIGFQKNMRGWKTFILPTEGGKSVKIGPRNFNSQVPSWSSDSQEIFYHDHAHLPYSVNITSISSKQETMLIDKVENVEWDWGTWSPDSRHIALIDGFDMEDTTEDIGRLHLLDTDSKTSVYLASVPMPRWNPAYKLPVWIADNSGLFSIVEHEGFPELAHISLPEGEIDILTQSQHLKHSLAISPDQELVAYISADETGEHENVWIYDVVLGESYQLTNTTGRKAIPIFSPSSSRIIFFSETTEAELVIVDVDNGDVDMRINIPNRWELNPVWLDEETVSFTSVLTGHQHRVCIIRSLNRDQKDIVISTDDHLIFPIFLRNNDTLLYQVGWPFGPLHTQDIRTGDISIFADTNAHVPMISPDGKSVAYLSPLDALKTTSLRRENVAHIVSQNRLP